MPNGLQCLIHSNFLRPALRKYGGHGKMEQVDVESWPVESTFDCDRFVTSLRDLMHLRLTP